MFNIPMKMKRVETVAGLPVSSIFYFFVPCFVFLIALALTPATEQPAYGQEIKDTTCEDTALAIIPFVNRPQSVERSRVNFQVTEILAAQLPCARVLAALGPQVAALMEAEENRGTHRFDASVEALRLFVMNERQRNPDSLAALIQRGSKDDPSRSLPVQFLAGFVEEIFGFTALTVIHVLPSGNAEVYKFTLKTGDLVSAGDRVRATLEWDDGAVARLVRGRKEMIPVALEPWDDAARLGGGASSDLDSDKVRHEVRNFLVSRLSYPASRGIFERKQFFRLAHAQDVGVRYRLNLKVESLGTRVFGMVRVSDGRREKSLWVEDDVTNLQKFEDRLLSGAQQALSGLEGLYDYTAAAGVAVMAHGSQISPLFGASLRKNLGSFAATGRVRVGDSELSDKSDQSQTVILAGLAGGYQVLDTARLGVDLGIGADGGIAQLEAPEGTGIKAPEPNLYVSGSVYAQGSLFLFRGLSMVLRLGVEKPFEIPTGQGQTSGALPLQWDGFMGLGYSF